MQPSLSFVYVGYRFPDMDGKTVLVHTIADRAGIPYMLLKNRMGMKKTRSAGVAPIVITDADLAPRKRKMRKRVKSPLSDQEKLNKTSTTWLQRPIK